MTCLLVKKPDISIVPCYICIMTSLSKKITEQTQNIPENTAFGYSQLAISAQDYQSAAKVLERGNQKTVKGPFL